MGKINERKGIPLPKQIKEELLKDIREEKVKAGERIPSEEELAKEFGVSRMTVREAIVELISEGYLYRLPGKGTFLKGYLPEGSYIKSRIVIKVPNLKNSFYYQIISGAERVFTHRSYEFKILTERDNQIEEKNILGRILENKEVGVILISAYYTMTNLSLIKKIVEKIPVVVVDVKVPEIKVDTVVSDDFQGGYILTEHLIEIGYKKILHLAGPKGDSSADGRREGYIKCMERYGLEPIIRYTKWEIEDGYFETKKVFLNRDDIEGIFCCNDEVGIGCYRALKELGKAVPEDVGIAGYGNTDISRGIEVPFTTVDQSAEEMGKIAATLLLDKIEGKRKFNEAEEIKVDTQLIIRNSCGIYIKK